MRSKQRLRIADRHRTIRSIRFIGCAVKPGWRLIELPGNSGFRRKSSYTGSSPELQSARQ
jgi:hypothetical protein